MDPKKEIRPQPSERWAMYRLICPVVDAACEANGLEAFFEYSQPNGPNKRLSADIALMGGTSGAPVWVIEAKKYGRAVNPGMVEPYINTGAMGVVTNGNHWVFKVGNLYQILGPLVRPDRTLDRNVYDALVAILSTEDEASALATSTNWTVDWRPMQSPIKGPDVWKVSGGNGSRLYHEKTKYETLAEAAEAALTHASSGSLASILLMELAGDRTNPPGGFYEVNKARMVWWLPGGLRGARMNLTGKHLELLVRNSLVEVVGRSTIRASLKMHDKNTDMSVLKAGTPEELIGLAAIFSVR